MEEGEVSGTSSSGIEARVLVASGRWQVAGGRCRRSKVELLGNKEMAKRSLWIALVLLMVASSAEAKPNLIYILADDLRAAP